MAFTTWLNVHAAAPLPAPTPKVDPVSKNLPKPTPRTLSNPAGTAKAVAALARFANGQLGNDRYDVRVAKTLSAQPGAQQTAKRLVQAIEAMSPAERLKTFPGVAKADKVTANTFDRIEFAKRLESSIPQFLTTTVLPPDPFDPKDKAEFELVYRGLKADALADVDGTDEPVVYLNVIGQGYAQSPKYLPAAGTGAATAGAFVTTGAGQAWSSQVWPGGWSGAIVIVTAALEDNGDLAQRKQELELLLNFAISETDEDDVTQDRMEVLRRELEDALALLHLANPERWSARAVQVRKLTSAEYDALYLQPATPQPAPHKLTAQHDPRGASYTLYFDVPSPAVGFKTVYLKVKEVEALGADKDKTENHIADLGLNVMIDGNTPANTTRRFTRNKNLVTPGWTVERKVPAGDTLSFTVQAFDDDPPSSCGCTSSSGWPNATCYTYCASAEKKVECGAFYGGYYGGVCPHHQMGYDINPLPDAGYAIHRDIYFTYDLATNKLAGDISGAPGTYTVIGTDGQGIKARVVFEVGVK